MYPLQEPRVQIQITNSGIPQKEGRCSELTHPAYGLDIRSGEEGVHTSVAEVQQKVAAACWKPPENKGTPNTAGNPTDKAGSPSPSIKTVQFRVTWRPQTGTTLKLPPSAAFWTVLGIVDIGKSSFSGGRGVLQKGSLLVKQLRKASGNELVYSKTHTHTHTHKALGWI